MRSIIVCENLTYNSGIYVIFSAMSKSAYIGKSKDLRNRFITHRSNMLYKRAEINEMYGYENNIFIFKPLREIPKEECKNKGFIYEELFMEMFHRTGFKLFNRTVSHFHGMGENDFNWITLHTGVSLIVHMLLRQDKEIILDALTAEELCLMAQILEQELVA